MPAASDWFRSAKCADRSVPNASCERTIPNYERPRPPHRGTIALAPFHCTSLIGDAVLRCKRDAMEDQARKTSILTLVHVHLLDHHSIRAPVGKDGTTSSICFPPLNKTCTAARACIPSTIVSLVACSTLALLLSLHRWQFLVRMRLLLSPPTWVKPVS